MGRQAAHAQGVFHVDNQTSDAQQIIDALQQIQASPELQAEARTNPESLLTRLRLSGVARHAVAFGIMAVAVAPVAATGAKHVVSVNYWN